MDFVEQFFVVSDKVDFLNSILSCFLWFFCYYPTIFSI